MLLGIGPLLLVRKHVQRGLQLIPRSHLFAFVELSRKLLNIISLNPADGDIVELQELQLGLLHEHSVLEEGVSLDLVHFEPEFAARLR